MADALQTPDELIIEEGACLVLFAYDVGFAIDLGAAAGLLERGAAGDSSAAGPAGRLGVRRGGVGEAAGVHIPGSKRAPRYFDFKPAPLRLTRPCRAIDVSEARGESGGRDGGEGPRGANQSDAGGVVRTAGSVEIVLFDFGAISVAYRIPLGGPLASLRGLSESLSDNEALLADSRARVAELLEAIHPAVTRPELSSFVEDFNIFQVTRHSFAPAGGAHGPPGLGPFLASNRALLASILRAEPADLASQEIDDALSCHISYTAHDAALIDWNAALLFDADPRDAATALEFANVELLEMRHLDDRLDAALDEVYRGFSPALGSLGAGVSRGFGGVFRTGGDVPRASLRRISALQIDAALLFEGVNNALKLLGDQYLARLYRLAAQRFHLPEWDQSILRKLATLEGIYEKLSDRRTTRRMEILEWIIIALIAFEIVHSLLA